MVLHFCFENNAMLYRFLSHISHELQPCDISVFGRLKMAYSVTVLTQGDNTLYVLDSLLKISLIAD